MHTLRWELKQKWNHCFQPRHTALAEQLWFACFYVPFCLSSLVLQWALPHSHKWLPVPASPSCLPRHSLYLPQSSKEYSPHLYKCLLLAATIFNICLLYTQFIISQYINPFPSHADFHLFPLGFFLQRAHLWTPMASYHFIDFKLQYCPVSFVSDVRMLLVLVPKSLLAKDNPAWSCKPTLQSKGDSGFI